MKFQKRLNDMKSEVDRFRNIFSELTAPSPILLSNSQQTQTPQSAVSQSVSPTNTTINSNSNNNSSSNSNNNTPQAVSPPPVALISASLPSGFLRKENNSGGMKTSKHYCISCIASLI